MGYSLIEPARLQDILVASAPARLSDAQPQAHPTVAAAAPPEAAAPCASPAGSPRPGSGAAESAGNNSSQESSEPSRLLGVRRAVRKGGRSTHSSRASLAADHVDRRQAGVAAQQWEQAHSLEQQRLQVKHQRAQLQVRGEGACDGCIWSCNRWGEGGGNVQSRVYERGTAFYVPALGRFGSAAASGLSCVAHDRKIVGCVGKHEKMQCGNQVHLAQNWRIEGEGSL